jgi:prefoldin subunit 5
MWAEHETQLEQERKTSKKLKNLLKTTEKALNDSEKRISDVERTHQALLSEFQQELKSNEDAWAKAAESDVAAQMAKQELTSLRDELEQEIINLRAQLEHQQETIDATLRRHSEETELLKEAISEFQEKAKTADTTISFLKKNQENLNRNNAQLEDQLDKLEKESLTKQAELTTRIESEREEKETFRQQLELVKNQKENPRALQRAREENMFLKRKIKGMRDTQLEMDRQLDVNLDDETRKLREELRATQAKLKNAEKLAEEGNKLSRENQIHESAIDMLTEDMNALSKEKESLKEERDRLIKELSDIKEQFN